MADTKIISLDEETYGKCEKDWEGKNLPVQQTEGKKDGRFHPMRSLLQDRVPPSSLILTVSLTLVHLDDPLPVERPIFDGPCPHLWSMANLARVRPGETMVFEMHRPSHRRDLAYWLNHAHTIMGMNHTGFDFAYLRKLLEYKFLLSPHTHFVVDLAVINYLHSEVRKARSLKTLGRVLRTHTYDPETPLGSHRFPSPTWKSKKGGGLHEYNGEDSHNTVLAIAELARRVLADHPNSDKLTSSCLLFYSHLLFSALRMSEAGLPMSRSKLRTKRELLRTQMAVAAEKAKEFGLIMEGEGSGKSKEAYIQELIPEVNAAVGGSVLDHRLLKRTDKKKQVSWGDQNRQLFQCLLPKDHPRQAQLKTLASHSQAQKLIGSYITPLLDHQANDPDNKCSVLLGEGDVGLGYPTIYCIPTGSKDDQGDDGGQQQGRISFKRPGAQTFPDAIKQCYASRFGRDGVIVSRDASQVELRGAALQSGEESLLTAFEKDLDLHSLRAIDVFGDQLLRGLYGDDYLNNKAFKNAHRQAAKHGNFTDLNWGSPLALQRVILKKQNLLIDFDICKRIVDARAKTRPTLYKWQNEVLAEARRTGYVRLPLTGQSRSFTGLVQSDDTNEVVNFPIQCFAANVTIRLQCYMDWRLPHPQDPRAKCFMFLNTYDALSFDCHKDYLPTLRKHMDEGVQWLTHVDIWHLAQKFYGRTCPLKYDETIKETSS